MRDTVYAGTDKVEPLVPGALGGDEEVARRVVAGLDRALGNTPERLTRAFESFSPATRARLSRQHRPAIDAMRENPDIMAESLSEGFSVLKQMNAREIVAGLQWRSAAARVSEAQLAADWSNVLGTAMQRALIAAYTAVDYGERTISRPARAENLRQHFIVGIDSSKDLPAIDPESADYTEMDTLADRQMPLTVQQFGSITSLSRKVITNDDVGVVQRLLANLGRAARRTLAKQVWGLWSGNATFSPDGLAWFHATHANAQSVALSATELKAAILKLLLQTEPGSGERLWMNVRPGSIWLVVPPQLWDTARALNATVSDGLFRLFGEEGEYILVNQLLTDTNDWGVHRDSRDVESIRVSYLEGREEPTIDVAQLPIEGQMFRGDRVQFKARLEFGVALSEFRGAVKAIV